MIQTHADSQQSRRSALRTLAAGGAAFLLPDSTLWAQGRPEFAAITDDPALPRALLIGDSISIGYTLAVRELLAGKMNVHRPPTNCGPTSTGLAELAAWLGDGRWDVIHFNWGLHDLKYMNAAGGLADSADGRQQIPIEQYEANLEGIVLRLKQTGASLIWANTTPVPTGAQGRVPGDAGRYNITAQAVMERHGIAVNDLYAVAHVRLMGIQRPANVHFTPEGSRLLAEQVARAISDSLPSR